MQLNPDLDANLRKYLVSDSMMGGSNMPGSSPAFIAFRDLSPSFDGRKSNIYWLSPQGIL
jgi:hypothetical protein